jgi:hypothetical protein
MLKAYLDIYRYPKIIKEERSQEELAEFADPGRVKNLARSVEVTEDEYPGVGTDHGHPTFGGKKYVFRRNADGELVDARRGQVIPGVLVRLYEACERMAKNG